MLSGPLSFGSFGGLVDGLLSATNCGGLIGVGKHDSGTLNLASGNPYSIGSYRGCLGGATPVSAKRR